MTSFFLFASRQTFGQAKYKKKIKKISIVLIFL